MNNIITAQQLAIKVKAFKHITKVLEQVEKNGKAIEKIGCTGVQIVINKGDILELRYKALLAQYAEEINSYQILSNATQQVQQ